MGINHQSSCSILTQTNHTCPTPNPKESCLEAEMPHCKIEELHLQHDCVGFLRVLMIASYWIHYGSPIFIIVAKSVKISTSQFFDPKN